MADGKTLHDILREFAEQTEGWTFPLENSLDYQTGHGAPAGFVVSDKVKGLERGAVAIANLDGKLPNHFRVPNIVPRDCSHVPMDKYNAIGLAFAQSVPAIPENQQNRRRGESDQSASRSRKGQRAARTVFIRWCHSRKFGSVFGSR